MLDHKGNTFLEISEVNAGIIFKEFAEMCHIIKPKRIGNFLHAPVGMDGQPFCFFHQVLLDMITGGITGDLFNNLVEIAGSNI